MTILATHSALCTVVAGSSGINTAPTAMPMALNAADLPCAIVIPGPAKWNEHAVGLYRQDRTYLVNVYVLPVAQGQGVDEGFQKCLPIMQALGYTLLTNFDLSGAVDRIGDKDGRTSFTDGGIRGDMTFGDVTYHGFQLVLPIIEKAT